MDRENDSKDEGPPLFFYKWLWRPTFSMTRIVYEPLSVLVVAFTLHALELSQPTVLIYLMLVAQALGIKALMSQYEMWMYIRTSRGGVYRARILNDVIHGKINRTNINPTLVTQMPDTVPVAFRMKAARIVSGLDPTLDKLVSKVDQDAA